MEKKHQTVSNSASCSFEQKEYQNIMLIKNIAALRAFARWRLKQFDLFGIYDSDEVINEACLRWHRSQAGSNPPDWSVSWMKGTILNIVRETKRKHQGQRNYQPVKKVSIDEVPSVANKLIAISEEANCDERWQSVQVAMSQLTPDKRRILQMHYVERLSWQQITDDYVARGQSVKTATLRKRAERALEDLRRACDDPSC